MTLLAALVALILTGFTGDMTFTVFMSTQGFDIFLNNFANVQRWGFYASFPLWILVLVFLTPRVVEEIRNATSVRAVGTWTDLLNLLYEVKLLGIYVGFLMLILHFLPIVSWFTWKVAEDAALSYGPTGITSGFFWLDFVVQAFITLVTCGLR